MKYRYDSGDNTYARIAVKTNNTTDDFACCDNTMNMVYINSSDSPINYVMVLTDNSGIIEHSEINDNSSENNLNVTASVAFYLNQ